MAILEWEDRFNVGVRIVDKQHKRLIDMINELHSAMVDRATKEKLGQIVDNMAEYAVSHFAAEEDVMVKFGYPGYERHKKEHDGFVEKAIDLQQRIATGVLVLSLEVINFLRDWLTNHILKSDMEFGPFFNANGVK